MLWHGKNFRGILTKAKEMIFDNTGTDLISTNAEDAIKEVNSNIVKHDLDTAIDISSHTSSSDLYTIPDDGHVQLGSGNVAGNYVVAIINEAMSGSATCTSNNVFSYHIIPVKKGMTVRFTISGNGYGKYFKLI